MTAPVDQTVKGYAVFVKTETVRMPLLTADPDKARALVDDVGTQKLVAMALLRYGATADHGDWTYIGTEPADG